MEAASEGVRVELEEEREGLEDFHLQTSIIDAVLESCPESEADEIWGVVGWSLVEQARDLKEEANILLEIWRQLKDDQEKDVALVESHFPPQLPEPPMVRERIIREIDFLVDHLRGSGGGSLRPTSALSSEDGKEILDYIRVKSGSGRGLCRSGVASRDGSITRLRRSPSSSKGSQMSVHSAIDERLQTSGVSVQSIDSAVSHLREALEEEIFQRKEDIDFLQHCIDGEHTASASLPLPPPPPPSLKKLREFGTQLEREVQDIALSRSSDHTAIASLPPLPLSLPPLSSPPLSSPPLPLSLPPLSSPPLSSPPLSSPPLSSPPVSHREMKKENQQTGSNEFTVEKVQLMASLPPLPPPPSLSYSSSQRRLREAEHITSTGAGGGLTPFPHPPSGQCPNPSLNQLRSLRSKVIRAQPPSSMPLSPGNV